jgi:hypothetical protein
VKKKEKWTEKLEYREIRGVLHTKGRSISAIGTALLRCCGGLTSGGH